MRYVLCRNPLCGKILNREIGERRLYCTNACRQQAYRNRTHKPKQVTIREWERYCVNCGNRFSTTRPTQQFCRASCRSSFHQQMKRLRSKTDAM